MQQTKPGWASKINLEISFIYKICAGRLHVGWVPCHDGMARPQVANGGKSSGYEG
jgi:hypothetical protein